MTYVNSVRPVASIGTRQYADEAVSASNSSPLVEIERAYSDLDVVVAHAERTLWCYLKPQARPSFTEAMLRDLHRAQGLIGQAFEGCSSSADAPLQYCVLGSRTPGVCNLGGDLALFSAKIQAGDREGLRRYAHSCVEAVYLNSVGYNHGIITVGLAQGDALGGGWECLMSCDKLIAERQAKFSLPEVLFNLFPGMGAHSYLTRRIGAARAEQIIMSGKVYTAEELHGMGLVDVLAEDGDGERTVREWIQRNSARHNAHSAIFKARRRVSPVTLEELRDVTDVWVDAAFGMTEQDLRRMTQLAAAQDRSQRRRSAAPAAAAE